jgi:hypothetical protein
VIESWKARAREKWENVAVESAPFTLDGTIELLGAAAYQDCTGGRNKFHSSAKYRLLLAAARAFGEAEVAAGLAPSRP